MLRSFIRILLLIFLSVPASVAIAEEDSETWWTITFENDFIANDDSGYTNGIGVSWGHGPVDEFTESMMPNWLYQLSRWLPYSRDAQNSHGVSYRVAQLMYTPDDIREAELIEDDRPYAGILLWTANLHSYSDSFSNRYWASFGMVGPASGAEQVQEVIHEIIGVNTAKGWDNQLPNEFTFLLSNERLYRLNIGTFSNGLEYDLIGMTEIAAGTLRSEIGAGGGFRFGKSLQQSFSAASLIPGRSLNPMVASPRHDWHVFMNLYGRYVFNDITLDGTYFSDSHSVELTNEQFFVSVGGAWHHQDWGVAVSIQESTRTFEERRENTLFGSFSVTYRW
jgi:lipid A 3-O-deacylase